MIKRNLVLLWLDIQILAYASETDGEVRIIRPVLSEPVDPSPECLAHAVAYLSDRKNDSQKIGLLYDCQRMR